MSRSRVSLVDVFTLAVACAMFVAVGVPALGKTREYAHNLICASNLKQIGMALLNYTKENGGAYPRTIAEPDPLAWRAYTMPLAPVPFSPGGPAPNDVTAGLFLLLRTQAITPQVFVCPIARSITPWDFGGVTALGRSNFPGGQHLSYSYANPYPSAAATKKGYKLNSSLSAEFPVAADMNPGVPELRTATDRDSAAQMKRINSQNHFRGQAQNVLFGDGHVELLQNPFVGVQRDNIYTFGRAGLAAIGIIGSPVDAHDSVLLPVATVDPGSPRYAPGQRPAWPIVLGLTLSGIVCFAVVALARRWINRREALRPG